MVPLDSSEWPTHNLRRNTELVHQNYMRSESKGDTMLELDCSSWLVGSAGKASQKKNSERRRILDSVTFVALGLKFYVIVPP